MLAPSNPHQGIVRDRSGLAYSGRSQIIDPYGVVLADAGQEPGMIQVAVDLEAERRYRREFHALAALDKRAFHSGYQDRNSIEAQ